MTINNETGEVMESKNELFGALAAAQGSFEPVATDKKVDFKTSKGGKVKYNYASFSAIVKMTQKPLAENGLSVFQITQNNNLITTLAHKSGQSISSVIPLPGSNDIKQLGANLSYLRRYQYAGIVGVVVADEDNESAVEGAATAKKISQPTTAQGQPKNGNGKVADDPMTAYWTKANGLKIDRSHAQDLLKEHGPEKAITMLEAVR